MVNLVSPIAKSTDIAKSEMKKARWRKLIRRPLYLKCNNTSTDQFQSIICNMKGPRDECDKISTLCSDRYKVSQKHIETSSPKGNDAHLRAIIQSEKKWKHQLFRRLRAANSVVRGRPGRISNSSKLLSMSSLPVSIKRIPSRTTEKKWQNSFSNYNTICCHGNQYFGSGRILNSSKFLCMSSLPASLKRIR